MKHRPTVHPKVGPASIAHLHLTDITDSSPPSKKPKTEAKIAPIFAAAKKAAQPKLEPPKPSIEERASSAEDRDWEEGEEEIDDEVEEEQEEKAAVKL